MTTEKARSFKQGDVISYPYLWNWQAQRGETEGRKDRPVCVALPVNRDGIIHLFLLAITSTKPGRDRSALAIPETEARRAGLQHGATGWVIIDECNYDIATQSHYLDVAQPPKGRFSEAFVGQIKQAFRAILKSGGLARVDRLDG